MAEDGNTVKVDYTGTLDDGTVFDTSNGREPLEFTLGEGRVIPGFENAVRGMQVGESKAVTIPAGEAYGEHRAELIMEVERDRLPEGMDPQVEQQLQMRDASGQATIVIVTGVSENSITIDANHPLAGKDLTFELKLVAIE
ncbi:peptidylprolyl isomerase [Chloroflexota bacterium]